MDEATLKELQRATSPPEGIPFTQYLLPNGRKRKIVFTCDKEELYGLAEEIIAHDCLFEAEILMTGEVSLTVFDEESQQNIAIELTKNGPETVGAVEKLVRTTHQNLQERLEEARKL